MGAEVDFALEFGGGPIPTWTYRPSPRSTVFESGDTAKTARLFPSVSSDPIDLALAMSHAMNFLGVEARKMVFGRGTSWPTLEVRGPVSKDRRISPVALSRRSILLSASHTTKVLSSGKKPSASTLSRNTSHFPACQRRSPLFTSRTRIERQRLAFVATTNRLSALKRAYISGPKSPFNSRVHSSVRATTSQRLSRLKSVNNRQTAIVREAAQLQTVWRPPRLDVAVRRRIHPADFGRRAHELRFPVGKRLRPPKVVAKSARAETRERIGRQRIADDVGPGGRISYYFRGLALGNGRWRVWRRSLASRRYREVAFDRPALPRPRRSTMPRPSAWRPV